MAESIFYAVLLGAVLGIFYDLLRLPRLILNDKFFFDFFFWIVSAIAVFCYLLIFNNGDIRAVYIFSAFAGYIFVVFTLGYVTAPIHKRLSEKIKIRLKSFKKVLQKLYSIYYNIRVKVQCVIKSRFKGGKNGKGSRKKE